MHEENNSKYLYNDISTNMNKTTFIKLAYTGIANGVKQNKIDLYVFAHLPTILTLPTYVIKQW